MTVLEVTAVPFTPAHRGGGESYPWRLARELARYEDVISCFSSDGPVPGTETPVRMIPGRFVDLPPFLSVHNPLPTPATFRAMTEALLDPGHDVEFLHVHNLRTAMSTAWLLQARRLKSRRRFKVVLTDHNAHWFPFPALTASCADYYAPVSEESVASLNSIACRPSVVIPPGVPSDYPALSTPPRPFEARDIDLVFFGRIAPWKRPDLVLRLAHDLGASTGGPVRAAIAGSEVDPGFTLWLRGEAARLGLGDSVKFVLGPTEREAVGLLSRSKLHLLFSSKADAFGRTYGAPELAPGTVVEAGACGTPSVCSELPGVRQQVVTGRTGLVLPIEPWRPVVDHAQRLLSEPQAWAEMSSAVREFVVRERTYGVLAQRFSEFLGQIREGGV